MNDRSSVREKIGIDILNNNSGDINEAVMRNVLFFMVDRGYDFEEIEGEVTGVTGTNLQTILQNILAASGSMSAADIRDALHSLSQYNRLNCNKVRYDNGGVVRTVEYMIDLLVAAAVPMTGEQIRTALDAAPQINFGAFADSDFYKSTEPITVEPSTPITLEAYPATVRQYFEIKWIIQSADPTDYNESFSGREIVVALADEGVYLVTIQLLRDDETVIATKIVNNFITVSDSTPSAAKNITSFIFYESQNPALTGLGNQVCEMLGNQITHEMPAGTVITNLVPVIEITGVNIQPSSGVFQDFSVEVQYLVTAQDTSQLLHDVNITVAASTNPAHYGLADDDIGIVFSAGTLFTVPPADEIVINWETLGSGQKYWWIALPKEAPNIFSLYTKRQDNPPIIPDQWADIVDLFVVTDNVDIDGAMYRTYVLKSQDIGFGKEPVIAVVKNQKFKLL